MFYNNSTLRYVDISKVDFSPLIDQLIFVSGTTDPNKLCVKGLETIDVSNMTRFTLNNLLPKDPYFYDFSNLREVGSVFNWYSGYLKLEKFNFKKPTCDAGGMFSNCSDSCTIIDFANTNLKPSSIYGIFNNSKATLLNLGDLDVSACTTMGDAFKNFQGVLPEGSFVGWDTTNVENIFCMFQNYRFKEIDLTGLTFPNAIYTSYFLVCWETVSVLETIHFGNMSFESVCQSPNNMDLFWKNTKLTTLTGTVKWSKLVNISFADSPLTVESAMVVINGMPVLNENDDPRICYFHPMTYNALSKEQIAQATAKGWTIALWGS